MNVSEYILKTLQEEHIFSEAVDIEQINYIEEGYIDSFGIFSFVCNLEEFFGIEFSDDEIMSEEFQIVGQLIKIIEKKIADK